MGRCVEVLLEEFLESIRQLEQYTTGSSEEGFVSHLMVQHAVMRRL